MICKNQLSLVVFIMKLGSLAYFYSNLFNHLVKKFDGITMYYPWTPFTNK